MIILCLFMQQEFIYIFYKRQQTESVKNKIFGSSSSVEKKTGGKNQLLLWDMFSFIKPEQQKQPAQVKKHSPGNDDVSGDFHLCRCYSWHWQQGRARLHTHTEIHWGRDREIYQLMETEMSLCSTFNLRKQKQLTGGSWLNLNGCSETRPDLSAAAPRRKKNKKIKWNKFTFVQRSGSICLHVCLCHSRSLVFVRVLFQQSCFQGCLCLDFKLTRLSMLNIINCEHTSPWQWSVVTPSWAFTNESSNQT